MLALSLREEFLDHPTTNAVKETASRRKRGKIGMQKKLLVLGIAAMMAAGAANAELKSFTVNGETISVAEQKVIYDAAVAQGQPAGEKLEMMVKQIAIQNAVLLQEAKKARVESKPEVKALLKSAHDKILVDATFKDWADKNPVSESQLKDAYNAQKRLYGDTEYQVRHILVKTEDQAKNLIKRLKKGNDFTKLAKEFSEDKQSGAQGGQLGWVVPHSFSPSFGAVVSALKPGTVAESPIQTQYGFHVVQLDSKRPAQLFPSYEELKPQLKANLTNQLVQKHFTEVVKQAKIK